MTIPENSIESEILNALELVYYARRFKDYKVVISLPPSATLDTLLLDISFLNSTQAKYVIVGTVDFCQNWNRKQLKDLKIKLAQLDQAALASLTPKKLSNLLAKISTIYKSAPEEKDNGLLLLVKPSQDQDQKNQDQILNAITKLSFLATETWLADKLLFLTGALEQDGVKISHLTESQLEDFATRKSHNRQLNVVGKKISQNAKLFIKLTQIKNLLKQQKTEVALMQYHSGAVFLELFTRRGYGTLVSNRYHPIIRPAGKHDFVSVLQLLLPYFFDSKIIPVAFDQLLKNISKYHVYEIDNNIVGCAMLIDYGRHAELAKFATLPRYQGRGIARELALNLLKLAKQNKKRYVFALSTDPLMWRFFAGLGFIKIEKIKLPAAWQKGYNFKRGSLAFLKKL